MISTASRQGYVIRDRDRLYGDVSTHRVRAMGINPVASGVGAPGTTLQASECWKNPGRIGLTAEALQKGPSNRVHARHGDAIARTLMIGHHRRLLSIWVNMQAAPRGKLDVESSRKTMCTEHFP
jgi:hypothetical protein